MVCTLEGALSTCVLIAGWSQIFLARTGFTSAFSNTSLVQHCCGTTKTKRTTQVIFIRFKLEVIAYCKKKHIIAILLELYRTDPVLLIGSQSRVAWLYGSGYTQVAHRSQSNNEEYVAMFNGQHTPDQIRQNFSVFSVATMV